MVALAETQRQTFESRLDRIRQGGPNTMATIYAGPSDATAPPANARRKPSQRSTASILLALVLEWPFAFLIGVVAMFAGRVAAFQLTLRPEILPPASADLILLLADVSVAALLMIALGWAFRMRGVKLALLCTGFLAVMMGEALIIRQAPDAFVPLFSENYVAQQMSSAAPIETWEETLRALSESRMILPALPSAPTAGS